MILASGVDVQAMELTLNEVDDSGQLVPKPKKVRAIVYVYKLGDAGELHVAVPQAMGKELGEASILAGSQLVHAKALPSEVL